MSNQGWVKLHRKIQDHWLYQEERQFSRYEAWLDLIMMANHKDNKTLIDGSLKTVKKGQLITSIRKLCDKWNWSNTKVKNFLNLLQDDEMIDVKSDTKKTVITIVNYTTYHNIDNEKTTQERHESDTEATQKHTNKNVKNVKNDKNVKNNKDYTSKIKDLLPVFSEIKNFNELNKKYWDVIRETRKSGKINPSVIYNTMKKWQKYDLVVVEYALKAHIDLHAGKREEYTIGIMRNTSKEEAEDRLNSKPVKRSFYGQPSNKEVVPEWFKDRHKQTKQQEPSENKEEERKKLAKLIKEFS